MLQPVTTKAHHRSETKRGLRTGQKRRNQPGVDRLEERQLMASSITTFSVPISPTPVAGTPFTSVVATFTDADKNTDPSKYSAIINWGNGHTSAGTVVTDPKGGFDVDGTYTYSSSGMFPVSVQILDKDGDTATVRTTNQVLDAPITATGTTVDLTGKGGKNAVVAQFTDANPAAKASDFLATVFWGDGQSSTGTVTKDPSGGFDVLGSHKYAVAGTYSIQVKIQDGGAKTLSTSFYSTANLSSDGAVPADHTDPNLVNPWGIVAGPGGPWWINNNGTGTSELSDGSANLSTGLPFVTVPPPAGSPPGTVSAPTGIVFQNTQAHPNDFVVQAGKNSGPSIFIFATEDGTISGWNPKVATNGSSPSTQATLAVDDSASGAVFKGLALMNIPTGTLLPAGQYLFATDFRNDKVDVFNSKFQQVTLPTGAFQDPTIPTGYAPFGIQVLNGNLYVTYAQQDAAKHDDVAGVGHGFVDVFSPAGFFIQRIGGTGLQPELNSPWGMAMAPSNFGKFSNDLLVGNFGDSHISAFDPVTGAFVGQLSDAQGHPLTFLGGFQGTDGKGLWGLAFGNGNGSGSTNTLYFTSGINDESDGLFGSISASSFSTATTSSIGFVTSTGSSQGQGGKTGWDSPSTTTPAVTPSNPTVTITGPTAPTSTSTGTPVSLPLTSTVTMNPPGGFFKANGRTKFHVTPTSLLPHGTHFHSLHHQPPRTVHRHGRA